MPRQIIRRQVNGFVQIKNEVLTDNNLSLKAKGLYAYLYSKSDSWDFSYERIAKEQRDGDESVMSGLKELEEQGYLLRKKRQDGRVAYFLRWDKTKPWPVDSPGDKHNNHNKGKANLGKYQSGKLPTISNKEYVLTKSEIYSNKDIANKFSFREV